MEINTNTKQAREKVNASEHTKQIKIHRKSSQITLLAVEEQIKNLNVNNFSHSEDKVENQNLPRFISMKSRITKR